MLLAERYRVVRPLGVGGMASVFLAEDERLGRLVAVKRLHAERAEDLAPRFEREARLGASLNHSNVVSIFDSLAYENGLLLIMEYVDGEPLSKVLASGPLEPRRAIDVLRAIAAALDHAHRQGVVHRDVKPANVLLRGDGVVKLSDLGIATAAETTQITTSGTVLGTPAYMAPERLRGLSVGPAADIYALAAVAFEVLSGERAQKGSTPLEIAHRVATEPPPDLTESWPQAPPGAAEALKQGMAREPGGRPASAGELVDTLERSLEHPSDPQPATVPPQPATVPLPDGAGAAAPPAHTARRDAESAPRDAEAAEAAPRRPSPPTHRPAPSGSPPAYRVARRRGAMGAWIAVAALGLLAAGVIALLSAGTEERAGSGADAPRPSRSAGRLRSAPPAREGTERAPLAPKPPEGDATAAPSLPRAQSPGGDPAQGAKLNAQGYRLSQQGRYAEAVPILERAVASYPRGTSSLPYAYALYNYGRSLRLAGRPEEAIPVLEERLRIPNQQATVRRELTAARRAAGAAR